MRKTRRFRYALFKNHHESQEAHLLAAIDEADPEGKLKPL